MNNFNNILLGKSYVAVVGLGYVGLPIAVKFAEKVKTIGFDINAEKINLYKQGVDPTLEIGDKCIRNTALEFTTDAARLKLAACIIVAVPTPINGDKTPDLVPVIEATKIIGRNISKNCIVVFESTVYPGVTEDLCIKILEEESGMSCGKDFKVGYSPERINPGDKAHRLDNIVKIVSGIDESTTSELAKIYGLVVQAGVYQAPSIKVAEAAKLAENAQRDINIAFMNELAIVFDRMNIATNDVLKAMNTKWNALKFQPGLVGGHCIGVDPYYFIYQAKLLGYHSQIIAAGRKINDGMSQFVADSLIKQLIKLKKNVCDIKICIMGISFKENCPDVRNSRAIDVVRLLGDYGISVQIVDPVVNPVELEKSFGLKIINKRDISNADCLVFLVAHDEFINFTIDELKHFCSGIDDPLIFDIKNIYDGEKLKKSGFNYWSL